MDRLVEDLGWLARRRWVAAAAAALAVAGFATGGLPLLDAPGYELGMLAAWVAVALGAPLGIATARRERARGDRSPAAAAGAAGLVAAGLVALLVSGNAARAALGPCRVLSAAAGLVPLLALPSAALAAAVAVAAALLARGRRALAGALYAAAVLASLALTLRAVYLGPQAFALDPFLGWWPGPLYDEALRPDARLVLARLGALAWAVAIAAATDAIARARARRPGAAAAVLVAAVGAASALGARTARAVEGLDARRATIAAALGGRREAGACTILYPGEEPAAAADALAAECAFDAEDVARALGLAAPPRVTVYVYRSAAEKRRLVGAAATDYTKPWLREIHVLDGPLPLPTLRHELVHAVASELARGPLRVPARGGVLVSAGLVEGLAVAVAGPEGDFTVHEWARAMRDLGVLPDVAAIVGPAGFFGAAPARAYVAAGSFLRYLLDRRGVAAVDALYRTGDFRAAGVSLPEAVAGWQRFLDGVEVTPALAAAARERFRRGSLFARRCAREAAALGAAAGRAAAVGRADAACRLWTSEAALTGSGWTLLAAADALARAGDAAGAERALGEAAARAGEDDVALRRAIASARGDLAWRRGDPAAADRAYAAALALAPDRAGARLLRAKRAALSDPALAAGLGPYLLGEGDGALALARVAATTGPLAAYLVGRAALARGDARTAAPLLARAAAAALPAPIDVEAAYLSAEARCRTGDARGGTAALEALARTGTPADRERTAIALRRCAFDARGAAGSR